MANCKDCLSYDVCLMREIVEENYPERHYTEKNNCDHFNERSKLIELPCKVGDTVYFIKAAFSYLPTPKAEKIRKIELYDIDVLFRTKNRSFAVEKIGKTVFLTKEEAERALEEYNA